VGLSFNKKHFNERLYLKNEGERVYFNQAGIYAAPEKCLWAAKIPGFQWVNF